VLYGLVLGKRSGKLLVDFFNVPFDPIDDLMPMVGFQLRDCGQRWKNRASGTFYRTLEVCWNGSRAMSPIAFTVSLNEAVLY
jgi:hypothetical protein